MGRPPKKGTKLSTPREWARRTRKGWKEVRVDRRGRLVPRRVLARTALWYHVDTERPVLVVASRDPGGVERDDFLVCSDPTMEPGAVVSLYFNRWPVEDLFHDVKQSLGAEEPQTWKRRGPERAATLAYWLYSIIWTWYLLTQGPEPKVSRVPWNPKKTRPSFVDVMEALREVLWEEEISSRSGADPRVRRILRPLMEAIVLSR